MCVDDICVTLMASAFRGVADLCRQLLAGLSLRELQPPRSWILRGVEPG